MFVNVIKTLSPFVTCFDVLALTKITTWKQ